MRSHHRLATANLAVAAALLAGPVAAGSGWTKFSQTGTRAFAANEACAENPDGTVTCSGLMITDQIVLARAGLALGVSLVCAWIALKLGRNPA